MSRHSSLRASDADREAVAARLHTAAVEGRLEPDELEQRLHAALRARTYGELGRLVADLPVARERRRGGVPVALAIALRVAAVLAVLAVVVVVIALTAAWWVVWAVLWLTLRGRHGSVRCGMRHRPSRILVR